MTKEKRPHNSTYPKGGLLYSKEHEGKLHRKLQSINISFAALRVAADR